MWGNTDLHVKNFGLVLHIIESFEGFCTEHNINDLIHMKALRTISAI